MCSNYGRILSNVQSMTAMMLTLFIVDLLFLIGVIITLQEKLLDPQYSSQKPDNVFLQSFAEVVGNRWPSLASLLFLSPSDIGQIKMEKERVSQAKQALHMLRKWNSRENASYGQLLESLKTVPLFRC